jgi:hypothetical protein
MRPPINPLIIISPDQLWSLVLSSALPAMGAVLLSSIYLGLIEGVRRYRYVGALRTPVKRYSRFLIGYALLLTAFSLLPAVFFSYKGRAGLLYINQSVRFELPEGVVGFILTAFLFVALVLTGVLASCIDFRNGNRPAILLSFAENAIGLAGLALVLFYVLVLSWV